MVNFDNAATSFPKPPEVQRAADYAVSYYGGNAGRGGHALSERTSAMFYKARETAAQFFGAETENTIFAMNCTHALNTAIQGVLKPGSHVIISSIEHNSVFRPVVALAKKGVITFSIAPVSADEEQTVAAFRRCIRPETRAIVCTLAGNVTGQILPWKQIAALCKANHLCFIADGAQACGILPVSLQDGINILCTAGHKGLYGITGTGLLMTDGSYPIAPLMQGGTGSVSGSPYQPDFLPDALESGTQNITGAATIQAGITFVRRKTLPVIYAHESALCEQLIAGLRILPGITIYRTEGVRYAPLVSFNADGIPPESLAAALNQEGFCLRAGLHCAPLAHQSNGTPQGTVRFAPSVFNTPKETAVLLHAIKKCVRNLKTQEKLLQNSKDMLQ